MKLLAVLKAALPIPTLTDVDALLAWWNGLGPSAVAFIAAIAEQLYATGRVAIELPTGTIVTMVQDASGQFVMAEEEQALLCAAAPDVVGANGELLKIFMEKVLPLLLQILPLFLDKNKAPSLV